MALVFFEWFLRGIIYFQYTPKNGTMGLMESKPPVSDGQKSTEVETVGAILGTIGDTTWRMFVPAVGFTLLGVWADASFGTKPWLMALGIVIGAAGAALLVKKQIVGIKSRKESKK